MVELTAMTSAEFTIISYVTVKSSADHLELLIILSWRAAFQASITVRLESL